MKDLFTTAILFVVAAAVLAGAWSLSQDEKQFVPLATERVPVDLSAIRNRILDSEVVGSGEGAVVQFAYLGDKVTQFDENEVEWMRTENSWTRNKTSQAEFDAGQYGLETVVYPRKVFVERPDGWHHVERGAAPQKEFEAVMHGGGYFAWLFPVAHAETLTKFATGGDDAINCSTGFSDWATCRAATAGNYFSQSTPASVSSSVIGGKFGYAAIGRGFLPFDTSFISSAATITAATLNVYVTATYNTDDDGSDYITVIRTSQASSASLVGEDFDQVGSTEGVDAGQRKDITSVASSAYLSFTLNSTGRSWIGKQGQVSNCGTTAGVTCLGLREGHDMTDVAPDTGLFNTLQYSTTIEPGVAQDPYLSVTYTVPQAVLSGGGIWMGGGGGKLNVVGGKVQIN